MDGNALLAFASRCCALLIYRIFSDVLQALSGYLILWKAAEHSDWLLFLHMLLKSSFILLQSGGIYIWVLFIFEYWACVPAQSSSKCIHAAQTQPCAQQQTLGDLRAPAEAHAESSKGIFLECRGSGQVCSSLVAALGGQCWAPSPSSIAHRW